jgi:F-type H+-transporting ATPase subunit b
MPQFDFTTYSSQIFWFFTCFAVLYYFMAFVILPRIKNITSERKAVISSDLSSADSIEEMTNEVRIRTQELMSGANSKYKLTLDESVKKAAQKRELLLTDFKTKSEQMIQNASAEIEKAIENSGAASQLAASKLVEVTQNKIFN